MKRFKNILVVLDPEDQAHPALERAAALACLNQARLHVLVVLEDLPLELRMLVTALHPQELQDIVEREQRTRLDKWLAPLREEGISVTTSLEWSNIRFAAIIRTVLRHEHDLLIKTAQRADHRIAAALQYMGVDLRGADIHAAFQQVCREGMP